MDRGWRNGGGARGTDATPPGVSPGFVDTHRHAWQAQLRRSIPDVTDLGAYVMSTLAGIAPAYTPHDMHVGTRLAALTALDAGITTMLDFSHNSRTAAHSDAALDALVDTGIRGVHAAMGPYFGDWDHQWPDDLQRLVGTYDGANGGLVTLRLATLATDEIAGPALAHGPKLAAVARDLGLRVSIDAVFGVPSSEAILRWAADGVLHPTLTLIHATGLTADAWRRRVARRGTGITSRHRQARRILPSNETMSGRGGGFLIRGGGAGGCR